MYIRGRFMMTAGATVLTAVLASEMSGRQPALDRRPGQPVANRAAGEVAAFAMSHVLVKAMPGVTPRVDAQGTWSFAGAGDQFTAALLTEVLTRHNVQGVSPGFTVLPANALLARTIGLDRWHMVHVPEGVDVEALVRELEQFDAYFEHAETDAIGTLAEINPDDPHFGVQYALENTGQSVLGQAGVPGADVKAKLAWDISTGSSDVVIAVLDAGVDPHDDLPGALVPGWNTYEDNADTSALCSSHGTHVAGIAAARGDNATGIAGMNWHAMIMPVVVVSSGCGGTAADAGDGVTWAANNGADIISMSLQYYSDVDMLHDAILYARGLGIVVVAAAGNYNPVVAYPGAFPETICVAATNNLDQRASFSNPGPELTVTAPGDDIYSTTGTTTYSYKSGTSMATPLVSGLAALMMAVDPAITHDQIQQILINTVNDVDVPGFDNNTGHGRVDAHAALQETDRLLADVDDNGVIDVSDLLQVLNDWGNCPLSGATCIGDTNGDGEVDVVDLLRVLDGWG